MAVDYDYILSLRGTEEDHIKRKEEYHELINDMTKKYNEKIEESYNKSPLKNILSIKEFEVMELICNYNNSL